MTLKELELIASRNDAFRCAVSIQIDLDRALAELELLRELAKNLEEIEVNERYFCACCMKMAPKHDEECSLNNWKETYQP